jgi:hypothetical protein
MAATVLARFPLRKPIRKRKIVAESRCAGYSTLPVWASIDS